MPGSHAIIDLSSPTPSPEPVSRESTGQAAYRPSASSSRAQSTHPVSPAPRAPPTPSRAAGAARPRFTEPDVIELSDSDDDDVQITGSNAGPSRPIAHLPPRRAAAAARLTNNDQFRDAMDPRPLANRTNDGSGLDATLAHRAAELNELDQLEAEVGEAGPARLRNVLSPPPDAPLPRMGFGGAVFRGGNRQVRFEPGRPAQRFRIDRNGDEAIEAEPERRQPRRGVPMRVPDDGAGGAPINAPTAAGQWRVNLNLAGLGGYFLNRDGLMGALLDRGPVGLGLGLFGVGVGRVGRAPHNDDVPTILAKVVPSVIPPAPKGFTHTWDAEEIDTEVNGSTAIELDGAGQVVPIKKRQPYLACACCPEPLRVLSAARSDKDRVWALRCGHLVDERCLDTLGSGSDDEDDPPLLDDEPLSKKRRPARKAKKVQPVKEYTWECPVTGCARQHVSVFVDGVWKPKEGAGAVQIYV
ncbi:uncharacterized protein EHS24_007870 [Apiotrichum porosum]|uniref:Uncharacterized protein n=1 Tax=Apiotrichum porosum TaxID=105984 RepID=A0A427XS90_9TREE|nr:uncharacterized protein EHS24_007870 [Apiotrichum porosum]RSH81687.1 hypothetical protein EHS24_007870 [Apiotrichum porosum]